MKKKIQKTNHRNITITSNTTNFYYSRRFFENNRKRRNLNKSQTPFDALHFCEIFFRVMANEP